MNEGIDELNKVISSKAVIEEKRPACNTGWLMTNMVETPFGNAVFLKINDSLVSVQVKRNHAIKYFYEILYCV